MNRADRTSRNHANSPHRPASESARRRKKRAGRVLAAALLSALPLHAGALPTGGQVSVGAGSIVQSGNLMTVAQSSQNLAVNWSSFGIAPGETLRFQQPGSSAVALNRVVGSDPSTIYGNLQANGQVFLLNPQGILFGPSAQVSVGGLVASTLGLSDRDFQLGQFTFRGNGGSVINQGTIAAHDDGYVALLGGQLSNEGTIAARLGAVALAAGNQVTVDLAGDRLISLRVDQGTVDALARNQQLVQADGGEVLLTAKAADALAQAVVNNEGVIEARAIENRGGAIRLWGDTEQGMVLNTGALAANSAEAEGRSLLQAGRIEADRVSLSASHVLVQTAAGHIHAPGGTIALAGGEHGFLSGTVDASGDQGGRITVTGDRITLAATNLNASGAMRGGQILVGGGAHGADPTVVNAQTVSINPASTLTTSGSDGRIVVWSERSTDFYGNAMAGERAFVEISSRGKLNLGGTATAGAGGQVLLDPADIVIDTEAPAAFYLDLADPTPAAGDLHGSGGMVVLPNGNVAVSSPNDSFGGERAGAVYLYNGQSGALISALYGSHANDYVGQGSSAVYPNGSYAQDVLGGFGLTSLPSGNFVVASYNWDRFKGAVTWGSGTAGVSGVVSASNSLVGSNTDDKVGSGGVTVLSNGNYLVGSPDWDAGKGAATWGSGTTGMSGAVSAANSLVGSNANDGVGSPIGSGGITALSSGNYLVDSFNWNSGRGAVTWGSSTAGITGEISEANSLVGTSPGDMVGVGGVTTLANGNYVVNSRNWRTNSGAATWGNGLTGIAGPVSAANSLTGNPGDYVGSRGITALPGGNFLVTSPQWNGRRGAVTWADGRTGLAGPVSAANSLIGSSVDDLVGSGDLVVGGGVTVLTNSNYLVNSIYWNGGKGAVTWGSGTIGATGVVSDTNSVVGSTAGDWVGSGGVVALPNGHYVVKSPSWNGSRGAASWVNGVSGATGKVSASNSLVGSLAGDRVGSDIVVLQNGNYLVGCPDWNNGMGALTWASGSASVTGIVSAANSLTGSTAGDRVGNGFSVTSLANGNYVVLTPYWNQNSGAATWGSATSGIAGAISASNSLVGNTEGEGLGNGIAALSNGNYLVVSPLWNGSRGAITWASGTTGVTGTASSSNSLVGSSPGDLVGNGVTSLPNGNYLVSSPFWHGNRGAVTWGSGSAGINGAVSAANSLVGSMAGDKVGSGGITTLSNGNHVLTSPLWNESRGAATWVSGATGPSGEVSELNSLVGNSAGDSVGIGGVTALANGNYLVNSHNWNSNRGAVTWGSGILGVAGPVSATNSLVGSSVSDLVGSDGLMPLPSGNYVVFSSRWNDNRGAATWGSGTAGVNGPVSAANSLVGRREGDRVGYFADFGHASALPNGNYLINSYAWNGGQGALWLVADPTNLAALANGAASSIAINPSAIALAAGAGSQLTLQASRNITVNSPVVVAGRLSLLAGNELTLNAALTSTAPGDALVLAGRSFINRAGSGALSTPNGRWLVYSAGPSLDEFGGLASGNPALWNKGYGTDPSILPAGNRYLFSQPGLLATPGAGDGVAFSLEGAPLLHLIWPTMTVPNALAGLSINTIPPLQDLSFGQVAVQEVIPVETVHDRDFIRIEAGGIRLPEGLQAAP